MNEKKSDPIECKCGCHSHPGPLHFTACCQKCPMCGKHFVKGFDSHLVICEEKRSEEAVTAGERGGDAESGT